MKRAMSLLAFLTLTPTLLVACRPATDRSAVSNGNVDDPLMTPADPDLSAPAAPLGSPLDQPQAQQPIDPAPETWIGQEEVDPAEGPDNILDDVTLQVTALETNGEQIELDLIVTNESERAVALNATESGLILVDDLGNTYALATPEENPELKIDPASDWATRLVFEGELPEEAQFLTLITNFGPEPNSPEQPKLTLPGIPIRS
ncbi:MAG: hypothetical protein Q6K80_04845 [Thermostichus sp. DG_1_6_bins_120]